MSKLVINTMGSDNGKSGIGVYTQKIVNHLAEYWDMVIIKEDEMEAFANKNIQSISPLISCKNLMFELFYNLFLLVFHLKIEKCDTLFFSAGNRRLSFFSRSKMVAVVHDFSSLHVKNKYGVLRYFYNTIVLPSLMSKLDLIITVSESSKKDIVQMVPLMQDQVIVIPLGVNHQMFHNHYDHNAKKSLLERLNISEKFFLYVARVEHPGKNHMNLIKAFEDYKRRTKSPMQLVFAGPLKERHEEIVNCIAASPFQEDILLTGYLKEEDLPLLYTCAMVFVFPSLYEGFGLPILEAMACGIPVLCSNLSSLPEVGGDCVLYFDPHSSSNISEKMLEVVENKSYRNELIRKSLLRVQNYSWEKTAKLTLQAIQSI
ncbi:glycosyltransferase family 4 protein [bacterium]|nr:glycosyltransferase family 4 protein [bacterium]